jgi:dipeptidyl aminopeptidase/acylaminoacyl peptidase
MKTTIFGILLLTSVLLIPSCSPKKETPPKEVPQYSIGQFYKNTRISAAAFSPDETKFLVTGDRSGIFNLYEITIADGSERPVTSSTVESFFAVDYVRGSGDVLYSADKGGDENDHIYLLGADGRTTDLTPDPKEKANFGGWSKDRKTMYFISNRRDPRMFDLYRMTVGAWKPKMLYKNDAGYQVSLLSWDEKTVALTQSVTTSVNRLFLCNLADGKMTEVSDPDMPGIYNTSDFSLDNGSLYYVTDAGKEFQYLVKYDIATGKRTTVYETNWDVMYSSASENGTYRVIAVNADGKNVLKVVDTRTGADVVIPEIPDGDVASVVISPSEKLMQLTVGTSKAPSNIYVYAFGTKELKKLTNTLNPELDPANLVAASVVRFRSFDSLEIPAIFYKPLTASPDNRVPALVWVHGGPGGQSRVGYSAFIQYLVNHGYAVLAVNNRGSSGYGKTFFAMDDRNHGDRDLMDCVYGKNYLQSLGDVEPGKIGIIGGSYGGYMTMAAMTFKPQEFNVGVNLFGVTNWLRTLKSVPPYWESFRKALYAEMGDPTTADSVRLYNISPVFHADKVRNPVMVLQGANDVRVLQAESDDIVAAIRKNNVPVEYIIFPDEGHGFVKKENEIKGYGAVLEFLDKYLKATAPAGAPGAN